MTKITDLNLKYTNPTSLHPLPLLRLLLLCVRVCSLCAHRTTFQFDDHVLFDIFYCCCPLSINSAYTTFNAMLTTQARTAYTNKHTYPYRLLCHRHQTGNCSKWWSSPTKLMLQIFPILLHLVFERVSYISFVDFFLFLRSFFSRLSLPPAFTQF